MSNLKEIKRKIKSVHNTQKTTNAMKLVSTAKLKKTEEAAKRSRVYAQKIDEILSEIFLFKSIRLFTMKRIQDLFYFIRKIKSKM